MHMLTTAWRARSVARHAAYAHHGACRGSLSTLRAARHACAHHAPPPTPSGGMLALNTGLLTAYLLQKTSGFRSTRYLSRKWREGVSDFGPSAVIMGLSALSLLPSLERIGTFSRLSMPGGFQLSGRRALFVNMLELSPAYRLLALIPAIFLSMLFFLDQVMATDGH